MPRWAEPLRRARRGLDRTPSESSDGGGAGVVYARILDGDTLWLAVRAPAETVVLRDPDGGEIAVPTVVDGELVTARLPLTSAWPGETLVIVVDGEPAIWAAEPEQGPLTAPPSRDGRWQYAVEVDEGSTVHLSRTARPPEATLDEARVDGDQLVLTLDLPGGVERTLLLLGEGNVAAQREIAVDGTARLSGEDIPDRPGTLLTLAAGTAGHHVDVRRRRNALRYPGAAVLLPGLSTPGTEEPSPYLRWLRDGRLALARPGGPTDDAGT